MTDRAKRLAEIAARAGAAHPDFAVFAQQDIPWLLSLVERQRMALALIDNGLRRGKMEDQSILRWEGSDDITSLSEIVRRALGETE